LIPQKKEIKEQTEEGENRQILYLERNDLAHFIN